MHPTRLNPILYIGFIGKFLPFRKSQTSSSVQSIIGLQIFSPLSLHSSNIFLSKSWSSILIRNAFETFDAETSNSSLDFLPLLSLHRTPVTTNAFLSGLTGASLKYLQQYLAILSGGIPFASSMSFHMLFSG